MWPSTTATRLQLALMRAGSGLTAALELAQQLERFLFHLLFFFGNEGNDVVEDVHGGTPGYPRR